VFADVAGSTRLYETVGDDAAKALIVAIEDEIASVVSRLGGYVQEIVGDEVMFRFDNVNHGVSCAVEIQEAVEVFAAQRGVPMSVRIGLHFGPAIVDEGRMFGDTINTAARMAGIARGGQIVASEDVVKHLAGSLRAMARRFDEVKVKGKQHRIVVYDLPWRMTNLTMIQPAAPSPSSSEPALTLTLRFRRASQRLLADCPEFSIGRSPGNDLVVMWGSVSRTHATVEFGRERFVLTDKSTNGTYVQTQDGESVYLRRETLPLWGRGRIALGAPLTEGSDHVVEFECE
jgi:hypothetical protein